MFLCSTRFTYRRNYKVIEKLQRVGWLRSPTFTGAANGARARGAMDFSGAQTLMGTFKTVASYLPPH
jgi:hypothetical protein